MSSENEVSRLLKAQQVEAAAAEREFQRLEARIAKLEAVLAEDRADPDPDRLAYIAATAFMNAQVAAGKAGHPADFWRSAVSAVLAELRKLADTSDQRSTK